MPLVLDFSEYPKDEELQSLPIIIGMLRGYGLLPVGVRGVSKEQQKNAKLLELAIMPRRIKEASKKIDKFTKEQNQIPLGKKSLIIKTPLSINEDTVLKFH